MIADASLHALPSIANVAIFRNSVLFAFIGHCGSRRSPSTGARLLLVNLLRPIRRCHIKLLLSPINQILRLIAITYSIYGLLRGCQRPVAARWQLLRLLLARSRVPVQILKQN